MWTVLNSVLSTVLLGEARDLDKQPQCIPSFMDCTSCSTVTIKQVKKRKECLHPTLPFLQVGAGQDCRAFHRFQNWRETNTYPRRKRMPAVTLNKQKFLWNMHRPRWLRHAFHLFYAVEIAKVASILFPSAHRFSLPLRKTMGS